MIRKISILAAMIVLACSCVACQQQSPKVYQISTIAALIAGDFDGDATVGQLLDNGDFGLGTFNALDGEMIVLDGVVYQAKADGTVRVATRDQLVPFAAVTRWTNAAPTETLLLFQMSSLRELMENLDSGTWNPSNIAHDEPVFWKNYFVAAKIDGKFDYIKFRSPPAQERIMLDGKQVIFKDARESGLSAQPGTRKYVTMTTRPALSSMPESAPSSRKYVTMTTWPALSSMPESVPSDRKYVPMTVHPCLPTVDLVQLDYPTLAEALKSQAVFEKKEISGTLVAMRCPSWVGGANVPGWHMHFISDDRKFAGHVLDVKFSDAKATKLPIRDFQVVLPDTGSYRKVGQAAGGAASRPAGE